MTRLRLNIIDREVVNMMVRTGSMREQQILAFLPYMEEGGLREDAPEEIKEIYKDYNAWEESFGEWSQ